MLSTSSELSMMPKLPSAVSPETGGPEPRLLFTPLLHLRRHPLLAIITFLLFFSGGGYFLHISRGATYLAQSIVYVSPIFPNALATDHEHDREYDAFMEQQIYAVTRYENLLHAITNHRNLWARPGENDQDATNRLKKSLVVEQMGHSYQMSISLKMPVRDGIADFLNEITRDYVTSAHNDELYGHVAGISTLTADKEKLSNELDIDIRAQDKLLAELGIAQFDLTSANNPYDTQLQKLREQLSDAHERRAEADAQAVAFGGNSGSSSSALQLAAEAQVNSDPSLLTMTTQLDTRRSVLLLQINGLTPENPLYKQSQTELASIDRQLSEIRIKVRDKIASQLQQKYSTERDRAARLESQLHSDLENTAVKAALAAPKIQQAQVLGAEIQRLQARYSLAQSRLNDLDLEGGSPGSEHVVSYALTPSQPEASHIKLYWLALGFLSLSVAMAVATLADLVDPKLYTSGDIQRLIGFSPIGMLLDDVDFSDTMRSEYLFRLATGIDQAYRRSSVRTVVFTSAGTGSTTELVKQLGLQLANNGLKTLVILVSDAPKEGLGLDPVHKFFQSGMQITSSEVREERLVPIKTDPESSTPLFQLVMKSSQGLPAFLRGSSTAYTIILIGADPLLRSAHTEHLVRIADGTILVAESGVTTKTQLVRVAKLLERLKISGIAIVLSHIRKRNADRAIIQNIPEYAQRSSA